jgi:hypothetical protein
MWLVFLDNAHWLQCSLTSNVFLCSFLDKSSLHVLLLLRCLHHRDLSWQMDVSTLERLVLLLEGSTPQHRGLSCTWACLDNSSLCCSWTYLHYRCLCCTLLDVSTLQMPMLHSLRRIYTTDAFAALGTVYTLCLSFTWTCVHFRVLCCTWTV